MPKKPRSASSWKSSLGNACASSIAAAFGAMRRSQNRAKVSWTARCSSVSSKSIVRSSAFPAVQLARLLARDHAVADLLGEHLAIALPRIAVAAAAAGDLVVDRSFRHAGDQVLVARHDLAPVGVGEANEVQS